MSDSKEAFKEKIRSIGVMGKYAGTSRNLPVVREDNGTLGGYHTEHWNGSVDATVFAPKVNQTGNTGGE